MQKVVWFLLLGLVFGSCSVEKVILKSTHKPKLVIQKSESFRNANAYQKDFLYVRDLVKENFPYYERYFEGDFEVESQHVFTRLASVKEEYEFDYAVQEFLAKLHNNHTGLTIEHNEQFFPIAVRIFDGELVIYNVDTRLDSLMIGQSIKSINGISAAQLIDYGLAISSGETPFQDSLLAAYRFQSFDFYRYYNILNQGNTLQLTTSTDETYTVKSSLPKEVKWHKNVYKLNPITRYCGKGYDYKILEDKNLAYFQFNTFMDKPTMLDGISLYIRKPYRGMVRAFVRNQYNRRTKGKKAIPYIRKGTVDFKQFVADMFEEIAEKNIENLVIDMRYNGGGDLELGNYILSYLEDAKEVKGYGEGLKISPSTKEIFPDTYQLLNGLHQEKHGTSMPEGVFTQEDLDANYAARDFYKLQKDSASIYYLERPEWQFKGKVYLITSAASGSAASMFPVLMKDNALAEIIGVPPANLPTGPTVILPMQLPETKRRISISTNYLTRPDASKHDTPYLELDKYIPLQKADFFAGRDRRMEYIFADIEQRVAHVQR